MINGARLAQPIRGGVSNDGRLVFADDALLRLHHRAGGTEGGKLAIPGLAALAGLSHQLKMRLSRPVNVADTDGDLELWVEAHFEDDITKLSILGWSALPSRRLSPHARSAETFDAFIDESILRFDGGSRLLSAKGGLAKLLRPSDFSRQAKDIFERIFDPGSQLEVIVNQVQGAADFAEVPVATKSGDQALVTGIRETSNDGTLSQYVCRIRLIDKPHDPPAVVRPPDVLFGRQLAPVLRQPLGRIIANAETIGSELNGPIRENYALYAKDIANAARHLVALVDDLGDLEAVERVDFATAKDDIELGDVARRVAGLLALKSADHSIRINAPADSVQVNAVAEFRRVLQILLNLVSNAINYSPDGSEISIDIMEKDGASLVTVCDQGAGIASDDRERVFDKFERLGRSGDGGSGLGLYISRTLARAMGGDLSVGASAGGGAKFTLRLPSR